MLMCEICKVMLSSLRQYDLHQYSHRLLNAAVFKCKYDSCRVVYNNYNNFKSHVYTKHSKSNISGDCVNLTCHVKDCFYKSDNKRAPT